MTTRRVIRVSFRCGADLLIVFFGGDEVGGNLSGLSTRLQGRLSTLDGIVGAVEVPSDTANRSGAETDPKKGIGRAFWCLGGVFSEARVSEGRNPVRGGGASSQAGGRAERRANSGGKHGRRGPRLRVAT